MYTKIFDSRLTLAMPKQQKLRTPVTEFFRARDFIVEENDNGETGVLFDERGDIPNVKLEFVRAGDALMYLDRNVADMAVLGSDVVVEKTIGSASPSSAPQPIASLNVAGCQFQLAVPEGKRGSIRGYSDLEGLRIATSYPNTVRAWLTKNGVTPGEILEREGGVESSIRLGLADVVADLVDTGGTLKRHRLVPAFTIATTSATLYGRAQRDIGTDMLVNEFVRRLGISDTAQSRQEPQLAMVA